jgi:hypothetical protein
MLINDYGVKNALGGSETVAASNINAKVVNLRPELPLPAVISKADTIR